MRTTSHRSLRIHRCAHVDEEQQQAGAHGGPTGRASQQATALHVYLLLENLSEVYVRDVSETLHVLGVVRKARSSLGTRGDLWGARERCAG